MASTAQITSGTNSSALSNSFIPFNENPLMLQKGCPAAVAQPGTVRENVTPSTTPEEEAVEHGRHWLPAEAPSRVHTGEAQRHRADDHTVAMSGFANATQHPLDRQPHRVQHLCTHLSSGQSDVDDRAGGGARADRSASRGLMAAQPKIVVRVSRSAEAVRGRVARGQARGSSAVTRQPSPVHPARNTPPSASTRSRNPTSPSPPPNGPGARFRCPRWTA